MIALGTEAAAAACTWLRVCPVASAVNTAQM